MYTILKFGRFDHHQKEFNLSRDGVKYASCGLIWEWYGDDVLNSADIGKDWKQGLEMGKLLKRKIDRDLFQLIDAIDNGEQLHTGKAITLNTVISSMNRMGSGHEKQIGAFWSAIEFACEFLDSTIQRSVKNLEARGKVQRAYDQWEKEGYPEFDHYSNSVLILDGFTQWQDHLDVVDPLFSIHSVMFPDRDGWKVLARPFDPSDRSRGNFVQLPESISGYNDPDTLHELTGINDLIFTHSGGWIAGAKTKESAYKLASRFVPVNTHAFPVF